MTHESERGHETWPTATQKHTATHSKKSMGTTCFAKEKARKWLWQQRHHQQHPHYTPAAAYKHTELRTNMPDDARPKTQRKSTHAPTFPSGYSSQRAPTVHWCFSSTARMPGSAANDSRIFLAVSSSGRPGSVSMRWNLPFHREWYTMGSPVHNGGNRQHVERRRVRLGEEGLLPGCVERSTRRVERRSNGATIRVWG